MSHNTTERLMRLKESLVTAQESRLRAEGRLATMMQQLQTQFGCSTLEQAEAKQEKLKKECASLAGKLNDGLVKVEAEYDWEE